MSKKRTKKRTTLLGLGLLGSLCVLRVAMAQQNESNEEKETETLSAGERSAARFINFVECAIEHKGKFLVIERSASVPGAGQLTFPCGKVDEEDGVSYNILPAALKREVKEEVGLTLRDPLVYITSHFVGKQVPVLGVTFHCCVKKTDLTQLKIAEREISNYFWLTKKEILKHPRSSVLLKKGIEALSK